MTLGGWIIMLVSVASMTALFGWCLYKVLSTPEETKKIHGFDTHTPDQEK